MELIRTVVKTDLNDIKKFRDDFIKVLEDKKYEQDLIFKLRLIFDELTANSYKHGNLRDMSKLIDIYMILSDGCFFIKVRDEGDGISRKKVCDRLSENGRGIDLVKKLSDKMLIDQNTIACLVLN